MKQTYNLAASLLMAVLLSFPIPTYVHAASPKVNKSTTPMKNSEYIEKYAAFAQEQMLKYGIPASVTLAQGILESASGGSELSRKGNNHFGIKATTGWLNAGGSYLVYTDDRPNEKFCRYVSVGDSYEHHSLFLKNNSRYAKCFKLAADDYKGGRRSCSVQAMPRARLMRPPCKTSLSEMVSRNTISRCWP